MIRKNSMEHHYLNISHLNMEDITDTDYGLTKSLCKDFQKNKKIKKN